MWNRWRKKLVSYKSSHNHLTSCIKEDCNNYEHSFLILCVCICQMFLFSSFICLSSNIKYVNNFKLILWYCWVEQSINVSHVKSNDLGCSNGLHGCCFSVNYSLEVVEISSYKCRFAYFSLQFYRFLIHVF